MVLCSEAGEWTPDEGRCYFSPIKGPAIRHFALPPLPLGHTLYLISIVLLSIAAPGSTPGAR